jgi:gamma-glutamylcyclotransferase (GGCT)/AIG2-like uncharacterized protein YtfP
MLEGVAQEIVTGETHGELYALPEGYPAFLRGDGVVIGELVTIRESQATALLRQLDRFEGYFGRGIAVNLYNRHTVSVKACESGATFDAEAYFYADDRRARTLGRHIAGGDWLNRQTTDAEPR